MPNAVATAYGPPWDAMEGSGVTSTGIPLKQGQQKYVVAVDPSVIPYGTKLKIPNNPFGNPNIVFTAADTGGAIRGQRIDFFVASGRQAQNQWGRRSVQYQVVGKGNPKDVQGAGQAPSLTATPGTVSGTPARYQISSQFDAKGYQNALENQTLAGLVSHSFGAHNPLLATGVLSTAPVDPASFTKDTSGVVGGTTFHPGTLTPSGGGRGAQYVHPVGGKFSIGRVDNGVDFETKPGTALRAITSGTVVTTQGPFPGGSIVIKQDNGKYVYYGHLADGDKQVRPGQRVNPGQVIARTSAHPPGAEDMPGHTEIGYARSDGSIFLRGHAEGPTGWGNEFARNVRGLK